MGRDGVNVPLASNWLVTHAPAGIYDNSEQEHSPRQFQAMLFASNIHHN
jgi:hypothetical protein